jgi:hypothetical protein
VLQVKQLADFKTAELNAKVLQLESHIHWLQQENERLREELQQERHAAPGGAAAAADGQALAALQVYIYSLDSCDCCIAAHLPSSGH